MISSLLLLMYVISITSFIAILIFIMSLSLSQSDNSTYQKKTYKLLAALLSCSSPQHSSFVADNLPQLQTLLLGSLSTAGIGSKKVHKLILSIIHYLALNVCHLSSQD